MNAFRFSLVQRMLLVCMTFIASTNVLRGAIMRDDVPSSEYEAFFANPRFQSVGWLAGTNANGTNISGSGVLIAPDWVLTAAHVIDNPFVGMFDSMRFSLSNSIYTEPPNYSFSDALFVFPGWKNDGTVGNDVDLGLIHLTTPIKSVTPAVRFTGTDQRGTLMFNAGFGTQGTGSGGLGTFDGKGRAGSVIADEFASDPPSSFGGEQYWTAQMMFPNFPGFQPMEWQTSPGDSGGGWYADVLGNGSYQLVAINSFSKGGFRYGGLSGGVRVSLYNDWIDDTMRSFSTPEPGAFALVLTAMMIVGATRRFRAA